MLRLTAALISGALLLGLATGAANAAPATVLDTPRTELWQSDVAVNAAGANVVAYVSQAAVRYGVYVRSRSRVGGPYGAPVRVSNLTFERPADVRVAIDAAGRAVVVWRDEQALRWNRRDSLGGSWQTSVRSLAEIRSPDSARGSLVLDITPNGRATAAWVDIGPSGWQIWRSTLDMDAPQSGWSTDAAAHPVGAQPTLAIDSEGDVGAIWTEALPGELSGAVRAAVRPAPADWQPSVQLAAVGRGSAIAVAAGGTAIAAWAAGGLTEVAVKGADPSWSTPDSIAPSTPGWSMYNRVVSLDASGNALLIWSEEGIRTVDNDLPQFLHARRRAAGAGTWGAVETISVDNFDGPGGLSTAFRRVLASFDGFAGNHVAWFGPPWTRVSTSSAPAAAAFVSDPPPAVLADAQEAGFPALSVVPRGEAVYSWSQVTAASRGQILVQGLPVGRCAAPIEFNESTSGAITLTVQQLRINQRIYSAAIRRATAVDDWLRARLATRDFCGGGLTTSVMGQGIAVGPASGARPARKASPRPLSVAPAAVKEDVVFTPTVQQLRINQRVASKAVRMANAIRSRLDRGLSGGDIRDGAIDSASLAATVGIVSAAPAPSPAPTTTVVAPPSAKDATFTLSAEQLAINQRIGAAAVRRVNAIRSQLAQGLTTADLRARTITAADLAPDAVG